MSKMLMDGRLTGTATPYKGQLAPTYHNKLSGMSKGVAQSYMTGTPSYSLNPQITQQRFQDSVVTPAMRAYTRDIAPKIREAYAGGGGAFNSRMMDQQAGVLRDTQMGFSSELANMLYNNQNLEAQLAESAMNRKQVGFQMAEQIAQGDYTRQAQAINAKYQDFLRRAPENNPWINTALSLTGQSHMALYQPQSPWAAVGGAASGALTGAAIGSVVPGIGTGIGAGVGGLAGLLGGL